jgi:hypothetical protein
MMSMTDDVAYVQIERVRWEGVLRVATILLNIELNPIETVGVGTFFDMLAEKNDAIDALEPSDLLMNDDRDD